MSSKITKENLNDILKDLGKEYRKHNRGIPAEIVIIGGAAILANYNFRSISGDMDAITKASGALKDAAFVVGEKYGLAKDWLNSDFKNTASYSDKLYEHSKYYRTFSNMLTIRIVKPEYLLATKLRAARGYKHDLSDIVGIVMEEKQRDDTFTKEKVLNAYYDMYGINCSIDNGALQILNDSFLTNEPNILYKNLCDAEQKANILIRNFEKEHPGVLNEGNLNNILESLQEEHDEFDL